MVEWEWAPTLKPKMVPNKVYTIEEAEKVIAKQTGAIKEKEEFLKLYKKMNDWDHHLSVFHYNGTKSFSNIKDIGEIANKSMQGIKPIKRIYDILKIKGYPVKKLNSVLKHFYEKLTMNHTKYVPDVKIKHGKDVKLN